METPNKITIDLSALGRNLSRLRSRTGPAIKIMGVVKSDAYGHGLEAVSRRLENEGIDYLGVAHIHEALALRASGVKVPIVVLCGIRAAEEAGDLVENRLIPVVYDVEDAELIARESRRLGRDTPIHIKIDTGMGRLGVFHAEVIPFCRRIMSIEGIHIEAFTSHLASADEQKDTYTDLQVKRFNLAVENGRSIGLHLSLNNLANSAGIFSRTNAMFDMVRPGILLYGGLPSPGFRCDMEIEPVMDFTGRILQIRDMPENTPISYGRTYYTGRKLRTAVVSAGYGDGLPRSMSNHGMVIVNGKKAPIIGRICMNLTVCDITGIDNPRPGDSAVFLGAQGQEKISGDDIALWARTISYEIFCSIGQRHKKDYIE